MLGRLPGAVNTGGCCTPLMFPASSESRETFVESHDEIVTNFATRSGVSSCKTSPGTRNIAMTSSKRQSWRWAAIVSALVLSGLLGGVQLFRGGTRPNRGEHKFTGVVMASDYHLTLTGKLPCDPATAHEAVFQKLTRIDALMSTYKEDSDVSKLNLAPPGEWVPLSPETFQILQAARIVGEKTEGAYDLTVGPLVNLWGFGPEHRPATAPSELEISEARKKVGWDKLEIRNDPASARRLAEGVYVDLSSIAQGFAVDEAAKDLEEMGVTDYCLDLSGDIRSRGLNGRGLPWRIAIESPRDERHVVQRIVSLSGMSLTTSGDYRNYFEEGGVRYSHIIDPRTGSPITHRLASVTVVDPSCTRADAWDTALLALGPEKGLALAERENLAAFFIIRTKSGFEERQTSRFAPLLKPEP